MKGANGFGRTRGAPVSVVDSGFEPPDSKHVAEVAALQVWRNLSERSSVLDVIALAVDAIQFGWKCSRLDSVVVRDKQRGLWYTERS